MKLRTVFVNHCHWDKNHVCAVRLKNFAQAFCDLGHQVLLLTETLTPNDRGPSPVDVAIQIQSHDWSIPFYFACQPTLASTLRKARTGRLTWGLRQGVLVTSYLFRGGVFTDWLAGCRPYLPLIAEHFRPQIVWATFGNTDAWNIAHTLAEAAQCPWVADFKDNWSAFIPFGLRRLIASRYRKASHMTVFSEGHAHEAARWFDLPQSVIYSGFDRDPPIAILAPDGRFRILVTGGIYGDEVFGALVAGIKIWLTLRKADATVAGVTFSYAGNDYERVGRIAAQLDGLCELNVQPFQPLDRLRAMQRQADVNIYVSNAPNIFHHKVLELLSSGRPILCMPDDGPEAQSIVTGVGGVLFGCNSVADVAAALDSVASENRPTLNASELARYSWQEQARQLEKVFVRMASS